MGESEFEGGYMAEFRRYSNQEMTPGEQHRFEKRLLSDALFSDAYEGYVLMMTDNVTFPGGMGQILSEREKARKKVFPLWRYAAAAVLLFGLIGLGYLTYHRSDQRLGARPDHAGRAEREPGPAEDSQSIRKDISNAPAVSADPQSRAGAGEKLITKIRNPRLEKHPSPLSSANEERIAHLNNAEAPVTVPNEVAVIEDSSGDSPPDRMPVPGLSAKHFDSTTTLASAMQSKKVNSNRLAADGNHSTPIMIRGTSSFGKTTIDSSSRVVRGRVVGRDGLVIPGALILGGNRQSAVADESGYFKLNAAREDSVQLMMIGYLNKKVVADTEDLGSIVLNEDEKALSEVVVIGYGKPKKKDPENRSAEPLGGWNAYRKYIRKNSDIPGLAGNLEISFRIRPDGSLSEFQSNADQRVVSEAIIRIKKGPKWKPAIKRGAAVSEDVIVNFRKDD